MATASMQGDIALWDLDNRRLFHVMKSAHEATVHSSSFYTGQPLLVTASEDNSLKVWIFDSLDGVPRLLKSRSGHYKPPMRARFYGNDGKVLLSAGRDQSLRLFSMIRDAQNVELSQGSIEKKSRALQVSAEELKAPMIVDFDASEVRAKDWDNVLSCHLGDSQARTWSIKRKAIGAHVFKSTDASSIKVGYILPLTTNSQQRWVHVVILASLAQLWGKWTSLTCNRAFIAVPTLVSMIDKILCTGHTKAVVSIVCDSTNQVVITGSLDKTIRFHNFASGALISSISLDACISFMTLHRESNLLAVASDDLCLRIIDIETFKIVREFWGHEARITDAAFSPDARWIVSSSLDATIRTWDIPSSHLIDIFQVPHVPTSVTFSPNSDFLVSTHVDQVGLFVWANRSLYEALPMRPVSDATMGKMQLPLASGEQLQGTPMVKVSCSRWSPKPRLGPIFYLWTHNTTRRILAILGRQHDYAFNCRKSEMANALVPRSHQGTFIQNSFQKKRNKPKEPPKAPAKAPFFLSTLPGVSPKFVKADEGQGQESKMIKMSEFKGETRFTLLLRSGSKSNDCKWFVVMAHCCSWRFYESSQEPVSFCSRLWDPIS